jgi:hypothetical protein
VTCPAHRQIREPQRSTDHRGRGSALSFELGVGLRRSQRAQQAAVASATTETPTTKAGPVSQWPILSVAATITTQVQAITMTCTTANDPELGSSRLARAATEAMTIRVAAIQASEVINMVVCPTQANIPVLTAHDRRLAGGCISSAGSIAILNSGFRSQYDSADFKPKRYQIDVRAAEVPAVSLFAGISSIRRGHARRRDHRASLWASERVAPRTRRGRMNPIGTSD